MPRSLIHNLKYNKVLHERNVLMTFQSESQPYVHPCRRAEITQLSETFWQVIIHTGYQETLEIDQVMHSCALKGLFLHPNETIFSFLLSISKHKNRLMA